MTARDPTFARVAEIRTGGILETMWAGKKETLYSRSARHDVSRALYERVKVRDTISSASWDGSEKRFSRMEPRTILEGGAPGRAPRRRSRMRYR
jgi:hypothetical protein